MERAASAAFSFGSRRLHKQALGYSGARRKALRPPGPPDARKLLTFPMGYVIIYW